MSFPESGPASGRVADRDSDSPRQFVRYRSSAEQRPDTPGKIVERLVERVADPEGAEVFRQAHSLHAPREPAVSC
jgi:hypothetical protein